MTRINFRNTSTDEMMTEWYRSDIAAQNAMNRHAEFGSVEVVAELIENDKRVSTVRGGGRKREVIDLDSFDLAI
jgi:hypothetical protein